MSNHLNQNMKQLKKQFILCSCYRICLMAFLLLASAVGMAQGTISGKITEEGTDEPLIGVTVVVKGTNSGATTDINGKYTINASSDDILVFSFIGFETKEVQVESQSTIDLTMAADIQSLSEVIVVGYASQSREELSGAVSVVPIKEALKLPVSNATEMLQGRVSGVRVVSDGQPGEPPGFTIRGFSSPNGNDPLFIIDGMQTTDPSIMNDINPADIENISVLKDAASASIFGVRASNGVVIVTTKKGKVGGPTINFETFVGVQTPTNLPDMLTAQEYANLFGDGNVPEYLGTADPNQPYFFGTNEDNNRITPVTPDGTDWFDELFESAIFQNYNVSAMGGTEKGRYMLSVGYLDKKGTVIHTGYDRLSGRINTEFNLTDKFRVGQHLNVSTSNQVRVPQRTNDENPISLAYRIHPYIPVRDASGNFSGTGVDASFLGNAANPVAALERANLTGDGRESFRAFGDAYIEGDVLNNLTLKSSIGINFRTDTERQVRSQNPEHSEPVSETSLTEDYFDETSWVWSNTAIYDQKFGDHHFNALIGVEAVENNISKRQLVGTGFFLENPEFIQLNSASQVTATIGNPNSRPNEEIATSLFSVFGKLSYDYDKKYIASFSVRRDQTSRFTDSNNTGVFPAVSLAWALNREAFLASNPTFSMLKLRFSYGETGNQSIARSNPTVDLFTLSPDVSGYDLEGDGSGNFVGIVRTQVGNPNLTWETSKQINVGVDFGVFNNDIKLAFDYFSITTDDMIFAPNVVGLPEATSAPVVNIGSMENKGFDLSLSYGNFSKGGDFNYELTANVSAYKNELTRFNDESAESFQGDVYRGGNTFTRTDEGNPISYFFGRKVIGIFQSEDEVRNSPDQGFENPSDGVGRFKYENLDGDDDIDDDDRTFLGSPHPDFIFGFNAYLEYKNFDLSLFLTGSQGNEIYNFTKFFTDFDNFPGNRSARVLNAWTPQNTGSELSMITDGNPGDNAELSPNSYFVEDGSYLRVKNLQIGYNLPEIALSSISAIKSARIYVQGTNLLTFTSYEGIDPEVTNNTANSAQPNLSMGIDFGRYPLIRTYTLGVKVGF